MTQTALTEDEYWRDKDYLHCADDFYYWLANYGYMLEESGEVIGPGITLWPSQYEYVESYGNGTWILCGKARRAGPSWLSTNRDVYDFMFKSNILLPLIAQDDRYSMIHLKRARWLYNMQPPHIARHRVVKGSDSKHELGLSNGSLIAAYPCTGSQGRGTGAYRIRLDEFAQFSNAEEIYAAVYGAVRDRGQLVIITTGQGEGGTFHDLWQKSVAGKTKFQPIFLGWQDRPDRPANFRDGMDALQRQEFPETPEEMFLSTGVKFFDLALLAILAERNMCEPIRAEDNGALRIWAEPVPGRAYVIGADVADGGGDSCAACVDDAQTGETVAVYHSDTMDSNTFGDVLYALGKRYYYAFTGVERNNMGHDTIGVLLRLGYPNLYHHQHYDAAQATENPRAGWVTNEASRPVLLGDMKRVMADPSRGAFHDAEMYAQFRAFGYYKGRWDHPPNGHDDLVIAKCIAEQMRKAAALAVQPDIVVYSGDRRIA